VRARLRARSFAAVAIAAAGLKHGRKDVQFHDQRRLRRQLSVRSPEEIAEAYERALRWREDWRAEVADRDGGVSNRSVASPAPRPAKQKQGQDGKPSAQFAAAIARAELGRFYWKGPQAASRPANLKRKPASIR
jgi:hypothetical protein